MADGSKSTTTFRRELAGEIFIKLVNELHTEKDITILAKNSVKFVNIIIQGLRDLEQMER